MHKATPLCKYIFFPAFQGSAGPFPLHCLTATRLRGPFQSGLGLYVKNSWKSDLGVTRRKIWLKTRIGAEPKIDFHVVYSVTVVFLSLRVYNRAMDLIQKFSSDVEKIKKHYRAEHQTYNGEEVCNQVAAFFEQQNRDVASLAHSYASYWKEAYILPSQNMEEEPTREHIDLLAGMMALLLDVEDSWQFTECFTQEDWKQLCQLTNYEAEDLPLELLSSLMKNFVDNQAV